jgi:hypothetical protein
VKHGRRTGRTFVVLGVAAILVVVGLASAISAPAGPPSSNKADAYGGPVAPKPTNPKSVAECNKYYGAGDNPMPDARECRAIAQKNAGLKKCAKKKGAAKTACQKAVKKKFAKAMAKVKAQRAAEKACTDKYNADYNALNPDDPDYDSKSMAVGEEFTMCMQKARGA